MSRIKKRCSEPQITTMLASVENSLITADINAILAERGVRYGHFKDHAALSQQLKSIMSEHDKAKYEGMAPDQREALEMMQHKVARILNGDPDYADSWRDIAGYATLVADRLEGKIT